ncbi:PfkB family carbohydrate kinase [Rhizobium sp. LjRoot30]|uniref:PfkB family carbohydrate kinase n=1 Tax=Rhizobium sp. LjRoot30 TaxID=3342320 RepID=UPI003ECC6228
MKPFRFAAVGDNCIDRFQPPVSQSLVGGNAVNVAIQLARLGEHAFYFGAVGSDADGERTRVMLDGYGVDIEHVETRPGVTAYTNIDVLPSGERIIGYEDFGVCAGYRPAAAALAVLTTMDHVHLGWLDDGGALRRRLAAQGISLSQDISVNADPANRGVEGLTVAFASAEGGEDEAEARIQALLAGGARFAVVTRGSQGAMARSAGGDFARSGIKPVEVVDTTGAGDSFIAGFLAGFVAGRPLQHCLEGGAERAALTCTHVGGFPQEPLPLAVPI